jgi:putative FmdB family regulatory protein
MPLYEYACRKCAHHFETLVLGDERVECPECQSDKLERLLSVPARPKTESGSLPMRCNSDAPPCGPQCSRWPA